MVIFSNIFQKKFNRLGLEKLTLSDHGSKSLRIKEIKEATPAAASKHAASGVAPSPKRERK